MSSYHISVPPSRLEDIKKILEATKGYLAKDWPVCVEVTLNVARDGSSMVTYSRSVLLKAESTRELVDALVSSDFLLEEY